MVHPALAALLAVAQTGKERRNVSPLYTRSTHQALATEDAILRSEKGVVFLLRPP
jgi:hypothetical protein